MSREKFILALDQGTTSSRSILFSHGGDVVAQAQKEFAQIYPQPGWVEHDPVAIWETQRETIEEVLRLAKLEPGQIAAIGITNQRETTVVWNRSNGKPICPAIVWQDRRTADYCASLRRDGIESSVIQKTGLRLDPYFSATKIRWILENIPGARSQAEAGELLFGTIDTWLVWNLLGKPERGGHVTDASNASRTLLFNLRTGDWDEELLRLFGVPRVMLPEVCGSSQQYGTVAANDVAELSGVPIAGIAGDQQAALFGQACFKPGMAKNTYGTGCFLLMNTGTEAIASRNNLVTTVAWRIGNQTEYALEGSVFVAGAAVQWARDELKLVQTAQELDALAASLPDNGGVYLVPAFAGLGAPHWDPYARGTIVGMTRGTGRAHLCRAVLESIALQTADLIGCMEKDSGLGLRELRVDGGASKSQPLMQIQADLLGAAVVQPRCIETTAMGAAYLAGLAVGFWASRDDIVRNWTEGRRYVPSCAIDSLRDMREGWNRALAAARCWSQRS